MADVRYEKLSLKDIENEILRVRLTNLSLERELCFALTEKAKLANDNYGLAFSYTFLGDYYLAVRDSEACAIYLKRSRVLCEAMGYKDLLIRNYKYTGMFYSYIYDEQTALEYYLKSLSLAEELGNTEAISAAYNNIADCFEQKKNYKEALHYYKLGLDLLERQENAQYHYSKSVALTNLCNVSFQINQKEDLTYYLKIFKEMPYAELTSNEQFMLQFCQCLDAMIQQHKSEFIACCDTLFEMQKQLDDQLLAYDIYLNICRMHLDLKNRRHAEYCLNWLIQINQNEDVKAKKEIQMLYIRYCKIFDLKDKLMEAYEGFYNIMQAIDDIDLDTHSSGLLAKLELNSTKEEHYDLMKEKEQLTALMNIDDLTNTYNKRCLSKFLQENSLKDVKEFAIAMLDIDYFKEYNDIYGHQMGDAALIEVGKSMQALQEDGVHAYRYGGDEFTIIFENKSEESVHDYLEKLRLIIANKHMEHSDNPETGILTLSYGYAYTTDSSTSPAELLKQADQQLYKAKKIRKNG